MSGAGFFHPTADVLKVRIQGGFASAGRWMFRMIIYVRVSGCSVFFASSPDDFMRLFLAC
jgi:hypothetical protein